MTTESSSRSPLWDAEIIGGQERRRLIIVEPDPTWVRRFETERRRIRDALGDVAVRIDHVGSTAVPRLAAKPIIDIEVSVADVEHEDSYKPTLERAGYEIRVREPAHRMFRTPGFDVHVHVCDRGGSWERRHLLFRDWLRASGPDRQLYAETKRALSRQDWPTMNHYADEKSGVIADIMSRAEAWAHSFDWTLDRTA